MISSDSGKCFLLIDLYVLVNIFDLFVPYLLLERFDTTVESLKFFLTVEDVLA